MKPERARHKQQIVWASQLAEMTVCERRFVWKSTLGEQLTPRQRARIASGTAMHADLHLQSLQANPGTRTTKPIAAHYGATQPEGALRRFTETLLRSFQRLLKALVLKRKG